MPKEPIPTAILKAMLPYADYTTAHSIGLMIQSGEVLTAATRTMQALQEFQESLHAPPVPPPRHSRAYTPPYPATYPPGHASGPTPSKAPPGDIIFLPGIHPEGSTALPGETGSPTANEALPGGSYDPTAGYPEDEYELTAADNHATQMDIEGMIQAVQAVCGSEERKRLDQLLMMMRVRKVLTVSHDQTLLFDAVTSFMNPEQKKQIDELLPLLTLMQEGKMPL